MIKPTKLQARKLWEMIEGGPCYGPRRTTSLDIPLKTIEAMLRAGWIREIDGVTIEITRVGVEAYPVPMRRGIGKEYCNDETGVRLILGARGWTTKIKGSHDPVNCDYYFDTALKQAKYVATETLVRRVREADPATAAEWESGS